MKPTIHVLLVVLACAASVPHAWATAETPQGGAARQPPPPGAAPAAQASASQRQVTPAAKALNDANAIKDLDEKIAAIRKVIADFPKTSQADQANTLLLDALIKKGDLAAIGVQARTIVNGADEASKSRLQRDVASALLRGDVLLEDAETFAKGAVETLPDEKTYVEARKKEAAARAAARAAESGSTAARAAEPSGAPAGAGAPPAAQPQSGAASGDEMFVSRYKNERQTALATLGQAYAKRGKTADAEKALRDAYLLDRKSAAATTAALKLAEFSKTAGRDAEQFDYLGAVALAGRLTPEAYADFRAVYKKMHNGSLDGLEEALDARYEKEGPKAPEVAAYERAAERTDRLVLAEIFTGAGCPVVAADLAFESAMSRYGSKDLAVLMYRMHVPRPDPMTNPYTMARSKFYAVTGVPTYAIDGESKVGGGAADTALPFFKKSVEPVVDRRLTVKAGAALTLKASATDKAVKATVTVPPVESGAARLRLHLVLAEEQIRYSGENGIRFHPMVVRSMAADGVEAPKPAAPAPDSPADKPAAPGLPVPVLGFAIEPGKGKTLEYTFDLGTVVAEGLANLEDLEKNSTRFPNHKFVVKKHEVNPGKLLLVAFVQDEDSKQVLQAARVALK